MGNSRKIVLEVLDCMIHNEMIKDVKRKKEEHGSVNNVEVKGNVYYPSTFFEGRIIRKFLENKDSSLD